MRTLFILALFIATAFAAWRDEAAQARREAIIEEVNQPGRSWTAGVNRRFDGASYDYVRTLLGSLEDNLPNQAKLQVIEHAVDATAIPTAFDWRKEALASKCPSLNEVRDQSNCGSCWAFGASEAATDRICIQTNGATNAHISAEDFLSCCSSCGFGCGGGYPSMAWNWLSNTGAVTGGNYNDTAWCYAYTFPICDHHTTGQYIPCTSLPSYSTPKCQNACDKNSTYTTTYAKDKHVFKNSYSIKQDVATIQTEIQNHGPIEVSFTVYEDFESYTGGVYYHTTGSNLGGHAVKMLGWGHDNASGLDYWIVANSWNEDWGEAGFFRIKRGNNECGIEASGVAGMYA